MNNRIVYIMVLLLMGGSVQAEEEKYTALCIEDKNSGFRWSNGQWVTTNFKLRKYLIKRLELSENVTLKLIDDHYVDKWLCKYHQERGNKKGWESTASKIEYGCYSIRYFGEGRGMGIGSLCKENYI